jgi:hypothetical protein
MMPARPRLGPVQPPRPGARVEVALVVTARPGGPGGRGRRGAVFLAVDAGGASFPSPSMEPGKKPDTWAAPHTPARVGPC